MEADGMDAWKELDADGRETLWANWMHMACMDAGIGLETLGLDWTRMGLDWIGLDWPQLTTPRHSRHGSMKLWRAKCTLMVVVTKGYDM